MTTYIRRYFRGINFIIAQSGGIFVDYKSIALLNKKLHDRLSDLTTVEAHAEVVTYSDFVSAAVSESKYDAELSQYGWDFAEVMLQDYSKHCEQNGVSLVKATEAALNEARDNYYLEFRASFKDLMLDCIESNKIGEEEGKNYYFAMRHIHDRLYSTMFGKNAKAYRDIVDCNTNYQPVTLTAGTELIKLIGAAFEVAHSQLFNEYQNIKEFQQILSIVDAAAFQVASREGNAQVIATIKASIRLDLN